MKITKTERALLIEASAHSTGLAHTQVSHGAGCRKGGEGALRFNAAEGLIKKGLARQVSREGGSVWYRPGKSCRVVDLVIEITPAGHDALSLRSA